MKKVARKVKLLSSLNKIIIIVIIFLVAVTIAGFLLKPRSTGQVVLTTSNCPNLRSVQYFNQDMDNDGIPDVCPDNCPVHYNQDQKDKNGNGVGDMCDTDWGSIPLPNFDKDSLPDPSDPFPDRETENQIWGFLRGDANLDHMINSYDATFITNYLFKGGTAPSCMDAADANNDGKVGIDDAAYIANFIKKVGPAPSFPYPSPGSPLPKLGCTYYPLPTPSPSPSASQYSSPNPSGSP